jgi:hypothetical protein
MQAAELEAKKPPSLRKKAPDAATVATALTPYKLPNPWLADSEWLLEELAELRETILRIPPTLNNTGDINSTIDRCWRLEQNLPYLLHIHRDAQRAFAQKHPARKSSRRGNQEPARAGTDGQKARLIILRPKGRSLAERSRDDEIPNEPPLHPPRES